MKDVSVRVSKKGEQVALYIEDAVDFYAFATGEILHGSLKVLDGNSQVPNTGCPEFCFYPLSLRRNDLQCGSIRGQQKDISFDAVSDRKSKGPLVPSGQILRIW